MFLKIFLFIIIIGVFVFYKEKYSKKSKTEIDDFYKAKENCNLKPFEEVYNDLGGIEYFNEGFKFKNEIFLWKNIERITAYKKDLLAYDLIIMEIHFTDYVLTINEETPGWFQIVIKLKEIFEEIQRDWELEIIHPAFKENFTILYSKKADS